MMCSFCGGVVSWIGNLIDSPSTQCADCGQRNCQEVEPLADPEDDAGVTGNCGDTFSPTDTDRANR
jgi:hypothetical protein